MFSYPKSGDGTECYTTLKKLSDKNKSREKNDFVSYVEV
jgi:hypothetical protein